MSKCHRTETSLTPFETPAPVLDEWSALATFLADVIEKYASVLEIDKVETLSKNENPQNLVDTVLAA